MAGASGGVWQSEEREDVELGSDSSSSSLSITKSRRSFLVSQDPFGSLGRGSSRLEDEEVLRWAAWEKLPSAARLRTAVIEQKLGSKRAYKQVDLSRPTSELFSSFVEKIFSKSPADDNGQFLARMRSRLDKVNLELPTVEVRYENLTLEAQCQVGRASPNLINTFITAVDEIFNIFHLRFMKRRDLTILHDVSGIIKPRRMTLLLGPPGSGKSSLLLALAARLEHGLKMQGKITYNGHTFDEFVPLKTSGFVAQDDLHAGEYTVRETLDYSARYQGVGTRHDLLAELLHREKELGIHPDPDVDFYMKATAFEDVAHDLVTAYVLQILGLDVCADTMVGDAMRRGISGGQKKRLTIGEIIVGPSRTLFMDEITSGLDSATAFQIITCLGQFAHLMDMTIVTSLLQPPPEIFELFDDIILLSEGKMVYHGPRENVEEFFASCGFKCPPRKGIADFLQEVTSRKDQEQYWVDKTQPYRYISVDDFNAAYKKFHVGERMAKDLSTPYDKTKSHKAALVFQEWSLSQERLFKITFEKELLYLKRNAFVYVFKVAQIMVQALVLVAVFFRTKMHHRTFEDASVYFGALFASATVVMFSGFMEVVFTVIRLPYFYKQRDMRFIPGWAFALSTFVTRIPFSLVEATAFSVLIYYPMGFAPNIARFFRVLLLFIVGNLMATGLFRMVAGFTRTITVATSLGALVLAMIYSFGGFILSRSRFKPWWIWGYWVSPVSWTMTGLSINEFLAPQWNRKSQIVPGTHHTLGKMQLHITGFYPHGYWYWISIAVLVLDVILLNLLFGIAVTYMRAPKRLRHVLTKETSLDDETVDDDGEDSSLELLQQATKTPRSVSRNAELHPVNTQDVPQSRPSTEDAQKADVSTQSTTGLDSRSLVRSRNSSANRTRLGNSSLRSKSSLDIARRSAGIVMKRGMVLPFQPLSISFHNIKYSVDMPAEMRQRGATEDRLQLLEGITGAFRPGILTALVGVTGAGKSTLMDVLLGRKTKGYVEGDIRISGFPKNQQTFTRISGYCEQNDIHSPQLTVYESLNFSASLRLSTDIGNEVKKQFVEEVMELVELTDLRDAIVGLPAQSGLSIEQRKRLTIAVELVANPSIIFMDEPTSGLDARAAAIVMRTVRNTVDTGRTVVCTIHQPSIDIFESFDELLLLKIGGQTMYAGPLGRHSCDLVKYFEDIPGIPKIKDGYNPATWMLEVTTVGMERKLGIDFAEIYKNSSLCARTEAFVKELSKPAPSTVELSFPSRYSENSWQQTLTCLWKQHLTYWRCPEYNNVRFIISTSTALFFGTMFWHVGQIRTSQFSVLEVFGAINTSGILMGIVMSTIVQPVISVERAVFYRERATGMYSSIPYAISQVLIEIPYTLVQATIFSFITYSMINLEWRADKFFLYFHYTFVIILLFIYYGMMAVAITPNPEVATVFAGIFYNIWNIFSGFIIPKPRMPVWVSWYYWANPLSWHIYGAIVSQFGDLHDKYIYVTGYAEKISIPQFLRQTFGFRHSWLGFTVAMTFMFPALFAIVYIVSLKKLNFQQR